MSLANGQYAGIKGHYTPRGNINKTIAHFIKTEFENKRNKAISMMRGKSPPSDVEMSTNSILCRPS